MESRRYAQTLAKRIRNIQYVRDRVTFIKGDGFDLIKECANDKTAAFFVDPPYTAGHARKRAGARLYTHSELDHEELFSHAGKIAGDLLMTYDNAEEVIQMANRNGLSTQTISMKNTHHATMKELIIGHNLTWT